MDFSKLVKGLGFIVLLGFLLLSACNEYDGSEVSSYYLPDSVPKVVSYYKYVGNKKKVVKEIRYYINGQVEQEGNYDDDGKMHGKWVYYFDDGKKQREINYEHGKKNGELIEYYRSGKKMYIAHYQNDIANGKWIVFDENGNKVSETEYKNGQPVSDK